MNTTSVRGHHHFAHDGVAELEDGVDHHPLAVLDELVLLGEIDQVAQLGLGRERSLAEALAGRQGVADQDQQLRQRAQHPSQRVDHPGSRQRDRARVLTPEGARRDADRDVGDDDHRRRGHERRLPHLVEDVERCDGHQDGGEQLGGDTEQGEQVEVARRVVEDLPQPVRRPAGPRARSRRPRRGRPWTARPRRRRRCPPPGPAAPATTSSRAVMPCPRRGTRPSRAAARVCRPNISRSSSGSAWS